MVNDTSQVVSFKIADQNESMNPDIVTARLNAIISQSIKPNIFVPNHSHSYSFFSVDYMRGEFKMDQ
jgi:hypothetical protein